MKKTYISPESLVVQLRCKNHMLTGSLECVDETVNDEAGGWVKENTVIKNSSVWDNEW